MKLWQATGPILSDLNSAVECARPTVGWLLPVLAAVVFCARAAVPAPAFGARPTALVHASILIDSRTGEILEAYHSDRRAHPASLTKLMTLYLTFQRLDSGRLSLGTHLRVSAHAAAQQATKLWLRPGSTITVRAAILGITTRSANDAAVVLAENLGGSESRFARLMNREAHLLGMRRTIFRNASGLPDARQWTTARDMATLAAALIHTFPQYYHFFGARAFRFHGRIIYGHDHLLDECDGVDGMKTGYINASGFNIVTSAVRNDRRLVGVVLGGLTARARDLQMITLINRGFGLHSGSGVLLARAAEPPEPVRPAHPVAELISNSGEGPALADSRDWTIEVGGSFHSQHAVRRVLQSARRSAPSFLRRGHPLVIRLRGHRYRARFSQLSREEGLRACSALERKKFGCRILTHSLPDHENVASVAAKAAAQSD